VVKKIGIRLVFVAVLSGAAAFFIARIYYENRLLAKIIERLSADSRAAEAVVTEVKTDPAANKAYTTVKFVEFDAKGKPLEPRYFRFSSNIIHFQSLVIRFDDYYVKSSHPLKGRSAYVFMKAFAFVDGGIESYQINAVNEVPSGYAVSFTKNPFERRLWQRFWEYALKADTAKRSGIKNAQIEAPATKFIPGLLYTLKIEHDGGLRIDATPLPTVLRD